ncbi:MAG: complex I subunit 1 family protein [bacterium]
MKPKSGVEEPEYAVYFRVIDYESPGREYDTLEIRFAGSSGHKGVIELGMDGNQTDKVERAYSEMLAGVDPKLPMEKRFNFEGMPPQRWFDKQFGLFADSIAVNNRRFGTDSMEPAFGTLQGSKVNWRDLYTPDFKNTFYIHGMVNRNEEKASLVFFEPDPVKGKIDQEDTGYVQDSLDWRKAGGSFRVQRITDGGWNVERSDGTVGSLLNPGDSVEATIGNKSVKLTLKDSQYYTFYLMGKDIGIGILYIMAVTSLTVLGIFMAGFGSNNKWSLYGAMRAAAQLMSYEIPMTLAVLGPVIMAASLSTVDIVEAQRKSWFVIPQFLAFFIFLVTMVSEVNRSPFDLPEAESELVAGFHTEYTGLKFGFFFLAEYANMFVAAAVITVLFFGGWKGPFQLPFLGEFVSSFFWFMLKAFFWLCVFIWFRATFPRFRIDQMMDYAWKVLLPLAFVNIVATAYFSFSDWNFTIWTQNNWHIWNDYIIPLFFHEYTRLYAIPIIAIITILLVTDWIGALNDHKRAARSENAVAGDSVKP